MLGLTFAVVTGVAILLPGFFGILVWNTRSKRHAVSRPDLPVNALSVLTIGVALALVAHLSTGLLISLIQVLCTELGRLWVPKGITLYPAVNPIEMMLVLAQGGERAANLSTAEVVLGLSGPLLSTVLLLIVMNDDGMDMATEGWDFGGHGWAYTYIVQPAQHGYRPIVYVLTDLQHDGLGVGYRGIIDDIRLNAEGQTQSISLAAPARFLFEIAPRSKHTFRKSSDPTLNRYPEKPIGAVINLDRRVIHDIVVSSPEDRILKQLAVLDEERIRREGEVDADA